MTNNEEFITMEEALARIKEVDAELARRGISFEVKPDTVDDLGPDSDLLGPQTELSYRRMLKEIEESDGDE